MNSLNLRLEGGGNEMERNHLEMTHLFTGVLQIAEQSAVGGVEHKSNIYTIGSFESLFESFTTAVCNEARKDYIVEMIDHAVPGTLSTNT